MQSTHHCRRQVRLKALELCLTFSIQSVQIMIYTVHPSITDGDDKRGDGCFTTLILAPFLYVLGVKD